MPGFDSSTCAADITWAGQRAFHMHQREITPGLSAKGGACRVWADMRACINGRYQTMAKRYEGSIYSKALLYLFLGRLDIATHRSAAGWQQVACFQPRFPSSKRLCRPLTRTPPLLVVCVCGFLVVVGETAYYCARSWCATCERKPFSRC